VKQSRWYTGGCTGLRTEQQMMAPHRPGGTFCASTPYRTRLRSADKGTESRLLEGKVATRHRKSLRLRLPTTPGILPSHNNPPQKPLHERKEKRCLGLKRTKSGGQSTGIRTHPSGRTKLSPTTQKVHGSRVRRLIQGRSANLPLECLGPKGSL